MESSSKILVYGAYGYSAKLIINELLKHNVLPIIAGRNEKKLNDVSEKFGLEKRVFSIDNFESVKENLAGINTLLNCAGPFKFTAEVFINACIETKTNYIDITGEIPVLEFAWSKAKEAEDKGIVILPSAGFDVIPTDCLSKRLSEKFPNAEKLKIGIANQGGKISRGTSLTTLEMMKEQGKERIDSRIVDVPIGRKSLRRKVGKFNFHGISIPWGDVSSAFYSTKIPNIEVYLYLPQFVLPLKKALPLFQKVLNKEKYFRKITNFIKKKIDGPNEHVRENSSAIILAEVSRGNKRLLEAYKFMEGYKMTALGAAEIAIRVNNSELKSGAYTPSLAFGSSFMDKFVIERIA